MTGHLGVGISANRYPYVWDNPLNRYDLNGRDLEGIIKGAAEGVVEGANDVVESVNREIETNLGHDQDAANAAAGLTSEIIERRVREGRGQAQTAANVASEFWKEYGRSAAGWLGGRGNELGRAFTCIAERVVQQPGPVGCQEKAEQWKPEPEAPEVPPTTPPPGVPGRDPVPIPAP